MHGGGREAQSFPARPGVFVGAVLIIGVLIVGVMVMTVYRAADSMDSGDELSKAARSEIAHANCQQLAKLNARYTPNGDSVEPDITGLRLTRERQTKLGCGQAPISD